VSIGKRSPNDIFKIQLMNDLETYFRQNTGRVIHKCAHYFDIYEKHFSTYRGKELVLLEVGLGQGGSIQMWKHYFGKQVKIYGIDINPECRKFEEDGVKVFIGSQSDRAFLKKVFSEIPPVDILIDDGGHTMRQQIITFEEMFDCVKKGGIYLCEDLHTSYWLKYGGGYKRKGTFVEYSKRIIDSINAPYSEQRILKADRMSNAVKGLHFYNGMLVVEKGIVKSIEIEMTGKAEINAIKTGKGLPRLIYKPAYVCVYLVNRVLRFFRLPGIIWH
jgi:hypothetical protein